MNMGHLATTAAAAAAPAPAEAPLTLPAPPTSTPTSTNPNKVAFALVSEFLDATCHLPTDESSSFLFEKAREFFCVLGQELTAKFLTCQVPSEGRRRMLSEGSEMGFQWLLNDSQSLQRAAGEPLVVGVKHPDECLSSSSS